MTRKHRVVLDELVAASQVSKEVVDLLQLALVAAAGHVAPADARESMLARYDPPSEPLTSAET